MQNDPIGPTGEAASRPSTIDDLSLPIADALNFARVTDFVVETLFLNETTMINREEGNMLSFLTMQTRLAAERCDAAFVRLQDVPREAGR